MGWIGSPGGRGYRAPYGANNCSFLQLLTAAFASNIEQLQCFERILHMTVGGMQCSKNTVNICWRKKLYYNWFIIKLLSTKSSVLTSQPIIFPFTGYVEFDSGGSQSGGEEKRSRSKNLSKSFKYQISNIKWQMTNDKLQMANIKYQMTNVKC